MRCALLMQLNHYFNKKMPALAALKLLLKIKIVITSEKKINNFINSTFNFSSSTKNASQ